MGEREGGRKRPPHVVLFGGTFDPVHNAHLEVARAAAERFDVAKILFVPAGNPPHKNAGAQASWEDRVRMTELACEGEPRFEVSRIEKGSEKSYSVRTVERLLAEGATRPIGFLIGADAFAEIRTWHNWEDLVRLVEFIVVTRPGAGYAIPEGAVVHELTGLNLPVSSSEIRKCIERGDWDVPAPATVVEYIRDHALYQSQTL